jgi:hypothetical protein
MDTWLRSAIDYIASWIEFQLAGAQQPGVILAITHRGAVVAEHAFGLADLDTGEKLTPRHRFRIRNKRGKVSDIWLAGINVKPEKVIAREIARKYAPRSRGAKR